MFAFVTAGPNLPFTISLTVMVFIALLEGAGSLVGLGLSNLLETLIPEIDIDLDGELPDGEPPFAISKILGWLRFGQVPALILLIVFLTMFGLIGLGVQTLARNLFGSLMPGALASVIAFAFGLPSVRFFGGALGRIMPKDETSAVSGETFVGRVATITLGVSRQGSPAEARLQDQYGQSHYIMVEPDLENEEFRQGEQILLVSKKGNLFTGIRNTNSSLVD
ncbi:MAG: hypothetical protein C0622_12665 [Desulfuromonas sp.]|nr:MAG: hypothetical protein C0622_12665 [Desulfuromonas sp.]